MPFLRLLGLLSFACALGFLACGGVSTENQFFDAGAGSSDAASAGSDDGAASGDAIAPADGATGQGDAAAASDGAAKDAALPDAAKKDSGPPDAGKKEAGVCILPCHTNDECAQTCATPPPGTVSCCDTTTGVCYAASGGACPL